MDTRFKRLIDFLKTKYRYDPEGFRALLPGPAYSTPHAQGPNARNPTSDLSDDDLAYHRDRLASALRGGEDSRIGQKPKSSKRKSTIAFL